jgi:transposase
VGRAVARHCGCPPGPAPADPGPQQATGGGAAPGLREIRTRQRYAEVQILRGRGKGITLITRETGLSRNAVRRYYHARDVSELLAGIKGSRPSILDPYKPYLHRRWNDGCTNITRLHAEITGLGYKGSYPTTYAYLRQFGEAGTAPPPAPAPPKSRDLARWILSDPENLGEQETAGLAAARRHCPHLDALARHVTEFATILTGLHGDRLDAWITAVNADDQPELHSFARGIKRDHDAVRNGLTLPWNSGAVEGNNCKIKHIKRIMYGRANFDLLRKMAILN